MTFSCIGLVRAARVGVCVGLVALGCSSTTVGPVDTGVGPIAMDRFEEAIVGASCDLVFTCPVTEDAQTLRLLFGDAQQCRTIAASATTGQFDDLFAQVRAGTVRYDAAAARTCLNRLVSTCQINGSLTALCPEVFVGSLAADQPCWRSEECAGDAYCDHGTGATFTCPGRCRARVATGGSCSEVSSNACSRAGLSGSPMCLHPPGTTDAVCGERRRGAEASEGQACGMVTMSATLIVDVTCAQGLSCRVSSGTELTRTCQRTAAIGAACDPSRPCVGEAWCVRSSEGASSGTCVAVAVRNRAGETCVESQGSGAPTGPIALCNPYMRLRCVMGTCQTMGDGTVGAACGSGDLGQVTCNPGLYCDATTHQCAARRPANAACTSGRDCVSNTCVEGRCTARTCQ